MDLHEPYNLSKIDRHGFSLFQAIRVLLKYYRGLQLREKQKDIFKKVYDANIKMVDKYLSPFVDDLLEKGFTVILTSDHGENAYEKEERNSGNPYPGENLSLYETEIKVPLVFLDKRIQGPVVSDQLVSHVNLAPTICDLLGVKSISQFQGKPVWHRNENKPVFCERLDWYARKEAAWLKWPWKLIVTPGPEYDEIPFRKENHQLELYNLETDPDESENLQGKKPERTDQLLQELLEFIRDQSDYFRECHREDSQPEDKAIRKRLQSLGYLE